MTVLFCDGFDWYTTADLLKRYTSVGNATVGATAARAPGGQGLVATAGGGGIACYKSFGSNYTSGCVGFAIFSAATLANRMLFQILDSTTEQISVRTNGSSVLTVTRNGTVLATGSTVLSTSTWYFIELKFTINASSGVVEVKLNGASEIASTSSLNTRNTANTQWNGFQIGSTGNNNWGQLYDDVYVLNTGSSPNNDFLGPVRVVALAPSGNGATTDWTPNGGTNFGSVSESYEDGDTTFNQSATANQVDTFTMQDLPVSAGSVYAVTHHMVARQDAGAARTIAPVLRPASTDRVGTSVVLSSSYQFLSQVYDTSPETSSAWDVAGVNSLEAGYKLIS